MSSNTDLPAPIAARIAEHLDEYLRDPVKAHLYDTARTGLAGVVPTLLLRTKGRKSGADRYCVLQYYRPKGLYVIVASKGGTDAHPLWFENLRADPRCHVQIGAHGYDAVARISTGAEREELFEFVSAEQPAQKEYRVRTRREIPFLVLELTAEKP
jgi:deazaflavin-dependent oxidoreductase (nitroreductase family)